MKRIWLLLIILAGLAVKADQAAANCFAWGNLVGYAPTLSPKPKLVDVDLWDPWGMAFLPGGSFVVADSYVGKSTVYDGAGNKSKDFSIPLPMGSALPHSLPTGLVANLNAQLFNGAQFIYSTIEGTIISWDGTTSPGVAVDNSANGAVYYGLAIGNNTKGTFLYATNFHTGTIDVFDSSFNSVPLGGSSIAGTFTDPKIPGGATCDPTKPKTTCYAPFGIANIRGNLFVTYAPQGLDKIQFAFGKSKGYVDIFDTNGKLIKNLASKKQLNAPWGVAEAPANFDTFRGDILVGNFGDGKISAYDPGSAAYKGQLYDASTKKTMVIAGLWALVFGGAQASDPGTLYFTARLSETMFSGGFGPITPQSATQCAMGGIPY
jgi:uncharacterized protein (TIGR03118 family)